MRQIGLFLHRTNADSPVSVLLPSPRLGAAYAGQELCQEHSVREGLRRAEFRRIRSRRYATFPIAVAVEIARARPRHEAQRPPPNPRPKCATTPIC